MNYDGKTYRNLEGQVGYLTDIIKQLDDRITEVAANIPSKMIVSELPEEGDPKITYYVGPKGTEPNLYYEVWVWVQEEEDGPFVWRELEDTDQVDLSGYLQKVTDATTYAQCYVKKDDGTQGMTDARYTAGGNTIAVRDSGGRVQVGTPSVDSDATTKKYVDDGFVAKRTDVTSSPIVYAKASDGSVDSFGLSTAPTAYYLVQRKADSQISVPYTPQSATDATSKDYVDSTFLPKQTGVTTKSQCYAKNADGTQSMRTMNADAEASTLVLRAANGQLNLPNQTTYEPTNDQAISRRYADAHYGSGLVHYMHKITATFELTNGSTYPVAIAFINTTSTAYTDWNGYGEPMLTVSVANQGADSSNNYFNFYVSATTGTSYPYGSTGLGLVLHQSGESDIYISGIQDAQITTVSVTDVVSQL